jgi:hypothetical protein
MNSQDFSTTISVDATADAAVSAITNVRGWWSHDIDGRTDTLGEEFTFRGKDVHYSKIKVTELVPGERAVWLVLDNYMNFVEDQNEWKGTRITFEIAKQGGGAEIRFSHLGLAREYECFGVCFNAWCFFINDSLRSLITTGEGQPMVKDDGLRASRPV